MKTIVQTGNAKKELIQARVIIDQFINSCSHNLKGPLTSIEGLVMIAEYCTNPEEVNRCLGLIQQCTVNMLGMIHKLEEYTTNIQRDLNYDEIEADQLLGRVLKEYSEEIAKKKIAISTKVLQSHRWVADEHCNYLILKNLISNAIHFCSPDEKLKKVHVEVGVRADHIKVEVTDNGIGIPQQEQQKIFEPFHRSSSRSNGNGLGLFLVKGLMDKLKASISISSNENLGTSFFLSMPNNFVL